MNATQSLLHQARRRLETGRSYYVCHAIEDAVETNKEALIAKKLLKLTTKRLEGHETLEQWLVGVMRIKPRYVGEGKLKTINTRIGSYYTADTWAKLKATRLAWIDSLIEEFK